MPTCSRAGPLEEVTDPELMKAPLEQPGVVFRRLRGSEKEQMEALWGRPSGKKKGGSQSGSGMTKRKPKKPSRAALTKAEEAVAALENAHAGEVEALEKERRELERRHARALKAAEKRVRDARDDYEDAVADWEG